MSERSDHLPYEDDLAAYLLDALTPEEARSMERHLEGCARCRERAEWLRASVELLPATVQQVEPPPALKERLMATVRAEAGAEPAGAERPARAGARETWRRLFALPRPAIALGAVLIALGAGFGYALGTGEDQGTTATIEADVTPPGARAVLERDGDRGILRVSGLPQRPGRIYEVWLARGGEVRPAGLFQVDRRGRGAAAITAGLDRADQVMVSLEPPGGSAQPTSDPLVIAGV